MLAHEFWLEPTKYQVANGEDVIIRLRNGQNFAGVELPFFKSRIARFDWRQNNEKHPIKSRAGDTPAAHLKALPDGLVVLTYLSTPSILTYHDWDKFREFATRKGFPEALKQHRARALPDTPFKEVYTRYSKALIAVGDASAIGQDAQTGMEIEIVARANPYVDDIKGAMPIQVFYQGTPRAKAQIEVFEKNPQGLVTITTQLTDARGHAIIAVKPAHSYLLDTVILRAPTAERTQKTGVVWQSLWASFTFQVAR